MSKQLQVSIPALSATSYPIHIVHGWLTQPQRWLPPPERYEKYVIITDHCVKKHYGLALVKLLNNKGYSTTLFSFAGGEAAKTQTTKTQLEHKLLRTQHNRSTLCLALGGGVVGDLAGFLAATYMRGIDYIQLPTTLLAMV